jgi:predicted lipoprotein with Yx(FWY)xxD motif
MSFRHVLGTTIAASGLVLVAACGSSSSSGSATTGPPTSAATAASAGASTSAAAGGTTLALASSDLGPLVIDSQGHTLYLYEKDTGTTSVCTGQCAAEWPPAMVTGSPTVGAGLDKSLLGTTPRADGTMQVTYGGHPLYRFAGDKSTGQTNGQDVAGIWYVVGADGNKIDKG